MSNTSSKQLREIVTSLRDECIDLLPEEFHERVADASKAYFEQRKSLNAELQRLKDVERRAKSLDEELTEQRKRCDKQEELLQSLERMHSSAKKTLAESAREHKDSLNTLKTTMLMTAAEAVVTHLSLIGNICVQTRWLDSFEYQRTAAAEEQLSDDPTSTATFERHLMAAIGGYFLQCNRVHLVNVEGLAIIVKHCDAPDDFKVVVMTVDEATDLYEIKQNQCRTARNMDTSI
ncbi:MAG: hypothetical protein KDA89_25560 [Planctomycetaceae bacterium]|nr:hypothetical protein [Planctomycetaceae bacterium]